MFCKVTLSIIILGALLDTIVISDPRSFPACDGGMYINEGYTYLIDKSTKQRMWTACHFPHPMYDHEACGMTYIRGKPRYLCDPDRLLSHETVNSLVATLEEIHRTSTHRSLAEDSFLTKQRLLVWLILVNDIQVIDLEASTSCENDCGQVYPTVDPSVRNVSAIEVDRTIEHYSNSLRKTFSEVNEMNTILLFYTDAYKKVWVSVGKNVHSTIPNDVVEAVKNNIPRALQRNNFTSLSESILRIKTTYGHVDITPAGIILLFGSTITLFIVFVQILFLYLKPKVFPVWEESIGYQAIGAVLYSGLGIWVYEYMFLGIFFISERVSVWWLILPVIVMGLSFCLYFFGDTIIVRY